jgi:hypothetical protein
MSSDPAALLADLRRNLEQRGKRVSFERGLSAEELRRIEEETGVHFPPDLAALLRMALPVSPDAHGFPDWRSASAQHLRNLIHAPFEEVIWSIEHNGSDVWPSVWGARPSGTRAAVAAAEARLSTVSRLIPVYSQRYIPESPHEPDNPIFSVVGYDIVYYGRDLRDYLQNEFGGSIPDQDRIVREAKHIDFWSDVATE